MKESTLEVIFVKYGKIVKQGSADSITFILSIRRDVTGQTG